MKFFVLAAQTTEKDFIGKISFIRHNEKHVSYLDQCMKVYFTDESRTLDNLQSTASKLNKKTQVIVNVKELSEEEWSAERATRNAAAVQMPASSSSAIVTVPAGSSGLTTNDISRAVKGLTREEFQHFERDFILQQAQRNLCVDTPLNRLLYQKLQLQIQVRDLPISEWPDLRDIYVEPKFPHYYGNKTRIADMDPPLVKVVDVYKLDFMKLDGPPFQKRELKKVYLTGAQAKEMGVPWYMGEVSAFEKFPATPSKNADLLFAVIVELADKNGDTMTFTMPLRAFNENKLWATHLNIDMVEWFSCLSKFAWHGPLVNALPDQAYKKMKIRGSCFWEEEKARPQSIESAPMPKMLSSCPQNELDAKEDMEVWERQNPEPELEAMPADADEESQLAIIERNMKISEQLICWEKKRDNKFKELKKKHNLTGHDSD